MSLASAEAIVKALLYEGYILYPYRSSNVKNQQRWTFGGVNPSDCAAPGEGRPSSMQTECLVEGDSGTDIQAHVRFLPLVKREVGELAVSMTELPTAQEPIFTKVASLKVGEKVFHAWDEAIERHGSLRDPGVSGRPKGRSIRSNAPDSTPRLASLRVGRKGLKIGARVRLIPRRRADIMDLVLRAEVAVIEAIERDLDDQFHVAVVIEADPGREFGLDRMPGHRFFFSPEEIEPIEEDGRA